MPLSPSDDTDTSKVDGRGGQILERLRSSEAMKLTMLQSEHDELARRLSSIHDLVGAADSFVRSTDASMESLGVFRALHDLCLRLANKVRPCSFARRTPTTASCATSSVSE